MQIAKAAGPFQETSAVKQVKVLRGIKLAQFAGAGDCFAVRARQVADGGSVARGPRLPSNCVAKTTCCTTAPPSP